MVLTLTYANSIAPATSGGTIISGTGNIAKDGPGTLVLGKQGLQNGWVGNLYINDGTVAYFANAAGTPVTTNGLQLPALSQHAGLLDSQRRERASAIQHHQFRQR